MDQFPYSGHDHPDVVFRGDARAIEAGALAEVRGALAVANQFAERAVETVPTLVVRTPGTVWAITARAPRAAFGFKIRDGKVVHINIVFDRGCPVARLTGQQ